MGWMNGNEVRFFSLVIWFFSDYFSDLLPVSVLSRQNCILPKWNENVINIEDRCQRSISILLI